jgi:hypothetical protein
MFSHLYNLLGKSPSRLTRFGSDLQSWDHKNNFNCLIVMTGGNFYLGTRYLDMYQVGWKYYFPGLEGKWTSYQLPSCEYQLDNSSRNTDQTNSVFEKYNEICPGTDNKMIVEAYSNPKKDIGPVIFVKTNGKWNPEEVEQILL